MAWTPGYWKYNPQYPALDEYYKDFLEQDSNTAWQYFTEPAQGRAHRGFRSFLNQMGGRYHNKYLADLATEQAGTDTTFLDWLGSNRFNAWADYQKLSPAERGESPAVFAGRGRWVL